MPPAPLQSWLIALSMYPIGDHSFVYVSIWLLFDNIGGIPTFVGFEVCVCVYHMQLSDPLAGSPKITKMVGTTSFLVLALVG